ncbi:mesothelin-like protein [Brachyhypopomus gauderio]|uniref:mesothelin-like protein n=1 Tax=Brachyhypopomus gauderio TaxID=698409 RepID=UPI004041D3BE
MLLYYDYGTVQDCNSYFIFLGGADFSIPSSILKRQHALFNNAQTCLGISGFSLSNSQVGILGNMICTLDSSYIQNSDPLIIEKLKNCGDLTASQVTGIQTLLFSGNTPYGKSSTWNLQTLEQLDPLPLYLNQDFWARFTSTVKKTFLQSFIPALRTKKTPVTKLQNLFTACNSNLRSRRAAGCTTDEITEAIITDPSFPHFYDSTQFDLCLNVTTLTSNLAAITQKVVDLGMERVILNKLNQAYPSGLGDSVLQLLGSTSRVADVSEIYTWNITSIDTLSSLMNPTNGAWTSEQVDAIIMVYLSVAGQTLGSAELNAIGSNICSLSVSVLNNITADNLKNANHVNLLSCSMDQKIVLYNIANISFSDMQINSTEYYMLIAPFLGGAPVADIQELSTQNINMDISTFLSLNSAVVMV